MRHLIKAINCCKQISEQYKNRFELIDLISNTNNKEYIKLDSYKFKFVNDEYNILFSGISTTAEDIMKFHVFKNNKTKTIFVTTMKNSFYVNSFNNLNGLMFVYKRNKLKLQFRFNYKVMI